MKSVKKFLAIVVFAATLAGCVTNNRETGSNLITDDFLLTAKIASFDLPITNKVSDSVQATTGKHILLGSLRDELYGEVSSDGASVILPYSDSTDFGENPVLHSAYLSLHIDTTLYTDPTQEGIHQNITIYKLITPLDSTKNFTNSLTEADYDPTPINKGNPIIYTSGKLRIDITDEYAQELLNTTPEEFKDFKLFTERIKGFYITTDEQNSMQPGRLNILSLGKSILYLNYRMTDPKRNIYDLDTTESFSFGYSIAMNNFRTGSKHLENENPSDYIYLESLNGIKGHIDAKQLKTMLDTWIDENGYSNRTVVLSRAELTLPYEAPEDYTTFDKLSPKYIYCFTNNPAATDTLRFYKPLPEVDYVPNKGYIDRSLMQYTMDITSYIQNLITTPIEEVDATKNLWIAPMDSYTDKAGFVYFDFDNTNYRRIVINGPTAQRKPQLTLTYTVMQY